MLLADVHNRDISNKDIYIGNHRASPAFEMKLGASDQKTGQSERAALQRLPPQYPSLPSCLADTRMHEAS